MKDQKGGEKRVEKFRQPTGEEKGDMIRPRKKKRGDKNKG